MAKLLTKAILLDPCFIKSYSSAVCAASIIQKTALRSIYDREFVLSYNLRRLQVSDVCYKQHQNPFVQYFSTSIKPESMCWERSSTTVLLRKLEIALKSHQVDEAWQAFNDFKNFYGFPNRSLISGLLTELSYTSDSRWLQRACDLVLLILKEKSDLLRPNSLTKLCLSLARAQMPIPVSMILRLMLEKESLPSLNILGMVILHMVKTEIGTFLASNLLVEICDCFQCLSAKKGTSIKLVRPDTMIFNLVLDACVRFRSSFKGQQIIELMPQVRVIGDAHTINIIARIHEMNGQRDELKKFKDHIDQVSVPLVCHYWQFYDSLLTLHFKFNDIDAASGLIMDMYRCRESLPVQKDRKDLQNPCLVPIGSHYLRTGLKLHFLPELLHKDSVLKVEIKQELIMYKDGKLVLSNKALAKLIIQYKRCGRIRELSELLISVQRKLGSLEVDSLCSDVIDSCIHLGWLETAHDILDDMELAGSPMASGSYTSLLMAYYKRQMFREAEGLLKQIRKAGMLVDPPDKMVVSACISELEDKSTLYSKAITSIGKSDLAESIIREMHEEEKVVPFLVYEFNSSLYFFCKAKMMGDALKTYRRMQEMKIQPTVQTFVNLIYGYSSLEMYREITILWGDIKRNMENGNFVGNRDLYEFLLLNFIRGGYFERVMEIIGYMKEHGMYTDKWMYKSEFLKFHKNLYRSLKASDTRNEAQSKRLEHVRAFRKCVGID